MIKIFKTLSKKNKLLPIEREIIKAVQSELSSEASSKLQDQLDEINKIQRLGGGKEVNFYKISHGKPAFDERLRFACSADEALLATVRLVSLDKQSRLKVDVWLAKGRLFSLVFSRSPKSFFSNMNVHSLHERISDIKIWIDPMRPKLKDAEDPISLLSLTGWLQEWRSKGKVSCLNLPLAVSQRAVFINQISAQLPLDYLDLISQTEGAKFGACLVYGVSKIRSIVTRDKNYYMLAECQGEVGGALVIKNEEKSGEIYFIDYKNYDEWPLGKSLKVVLDNILNNGRIEGFELSSDCS